MNVKTKHKRKLFKKTKKTKRRNRHNKTKMPGKIFYAGIGCNVNHLHTKKEFLDIMQLYFPEHTYLRRKGDPKGVPAGRYKSDDINGWMQFANAQWV